MMGSDEYGRASEWSSCTSLQIGTKSSLCTLPDSFSQPQPSRMCEKARVVRYALSLVNELQTLIHCNLSIFLSLHVITLGLNWLFIIQH